MANAQTSSFLTRRMFVVQSMSARDPARSGANHNSAELLLRTLAFQHLVRKIFGGFKSNVCYQAMSIVAYMVWLFQDRHNRHNIAATVARRAHPNQGHCVALLHQASAQNDSLDGSKACASLCAKNARFQWVAWICVLVINDVCSSALHMRVVL